MYNILFKQNKHKATNNKRISTMQRLKQIAATLPDRLQTELKRMHYALQIKKGTFLTDEPEYKILDKLIGPGDWVIDIGANVGHYTKRFAELVGMQGRVIAFEPVPKTFSLLSANVQLFSNLNVTLINSAVSNKLDVSGISMPKFSSGLNNYYQAHISNADDSTLSVLTISLDSLHIDQQIALIKIDTEGHESYVLDGMRKLIERWHPVLIIETCSKKLIADLNAMDYNSKKLQNSPNVLFISNK
jgi:FkbM family methyltransferase